MSNGVKAWSYSRWDLYNLCPFKFKGEVIEKKGKQDSAAMSRGDNIHKAVAQFLTGNGAIPPEIVYPFHQQLYEEMRSHDNKVVEQEWAFTRSWQPTGWFAGDAWYRSKLDCAVLYDDLVVEDVDTKTGKRRGSNDEQMESQAIAVFDHFKPAVKVITRLVYIDQGPAFDEFAEYSRTDLDKLHAKWEAKVAPMFTDTVFAPRPNDKCRFCWRAKSNNGDCRYG